MVKLQSQTPSPPWRAAAWVALLIVAMSFAVWVSSVWHERRMSSAISEEFSSYDAAVERFENKAPAALQHARKTAAYLSLGLSQFFSDGSPSAISAAMTKYLIYFHPTASDLTCDFTQGITADCLSLIDKISTVDTTTNIPADVLIDVDRINSAVVKPEKSTDSYVYVLGGVYLMSKVTVRAHAYVWVPDGASAGSPVQLALPRSDFATRLIMLLRPSFVRAGESRLYWVNYGAAGTDGMSYDSYGDGLSPNAVLSLVPVSNTTVDQATILIQNVVNPSQGGSMFSQKAPAPKSAAIAPISTSDIVKLVLYYPKYLTADTQRPPGTRSQVASVVARVTPTTKAAVSDASGQTVFSISRANALSDTIAVKTASGHSIAVPAVGAGVVAATYSYNMIVAACFDAKLTSIRCSRLSGELSYSPAAKQCSGAISSDVAQVLPPYTCQSILNMADVAIRVGGLSQSLNDRVSGLTAGKRPDSDTLVAGEELKPGGYLISNNRAFKAILQADCNFVVWNMSTGMPVWATNTSLNTAPGTCEIGGDTGVITLYDSGAPRRAYWTSMQPGSKGLVNGTQGEFRLTLTNTGILQVIGRVGPPVWSTGPGVFGYASMSTCTQASNTYATMYATELSAPSNVGKTPWVHYQQIGKLQGWWWPGPAC